MKSIELVFFLYFCYKSCEADNLNTAQNSIHALSSLQSNPYWKMEFKPVKIIMDGKMMTLEKFQNTPTDATDDELNEFALKLSKAMYTALKCRYSDLLITTFFDLFDFVAQCDKLTSTDTEPYEKENCVAYINEQLDSFKEYIAKMIFNLMYFMTIWPSLKSTDHTLVKCLISFNLLLYNLRSKLEKRNSAANINSELDTKRVIVKMINLIEAFNCKYCYNQNANYFKFDVSINKDIDTVEDLYKVIDGVVLARTKHFERLFKKSMSLDEIFVSVVPKLNVDMYDPEFLLLEKMLSEVGKKHPYFPKLEVIWNDGGKWRTLKSVYDEVVRIADVKATFDYQVLLFEVIKDMFYVKFLHAYAEGAAESEVTGLFETFCRFIDDVLPRNYPTRFHSPITLVRNFLFYDLQNAAGSTAACITDHTAKLLQERPVVKVSGELNSMAAEMHATDMDAFVTKVTALVPWDSFVRVFELFSYESEALVDYRLRPATKEQAAENAVDCETCERLARLRDVLIAFHVLADGVWQMFATCERFAAQQQINHASVTEAIRAVHKTVASYRRAYSGDDVVQRLLWPLSTLFPERPRRKVVAEWLPAAWRTTRLTLNQLEQHAVDGCESPRYNRDAYRDLTSAEGLYIELVGDAQYIMALFFRYRDNLSKEVCNRAAESVVAVVRASDGDGNGAAVAEPRLVPDPQLVPDPSALRGAKVDRDSPPACLWDGSYVSVDQAYNDVIASLGVVVDYLSLVRLQLLELKMVVSRVFKTLLFITLSKANATEGRSSEAVIGEDAQRFKDLPFPESVKTYVRDVLDLFLVAYSTRNHDTMNLFEKEIVRQLEVMTCMPHEDLLASFSELNVYSITDLCASFHTDVERLKNFMEKVNANKLINDLNFSSGLIVP